MTSAEPGHPSMALIEAFSEIAQHVHSTEDHEDGMRRITETAVAVITGCEAASLSLLARDGPVTRAATDALASAGAQIQYDGGKASVWKRPCPNAGSTPPTCAPTTAGHAPASGWPTSWAWGACC